MSRYAPKSATVTKPELVARLAEKNPHLSRSELDRIVTTILDEISAAMVRGDRVELRDFGTFGVKRRDARQGRNPRTGVEVSVEAKALPYFKTGKKLRDRLKPGPSGAYPSTPIWRATS